MTFLEYRWQVFGRICQQSWLHLLDNVLGTSDHFAWYVFGTIALLNITYSTIGGAFVLLDITLKPVYLRKYKVQPNTNEPLDMGRFWPMLKQVKILMQCNLKCSRIP